MRRTFDPKALPVAGGLEYDDRGSVLSVDVGFACLSVLYSLLSTSGWPLCRPVRGIGGGGNVVASGHGRGRNGNFLGEKQVLWPCDHCKTVAGKGPGANIFVFAKETLVFSTLLK